MKIKNIKIKNFKSIKNIDFDPSELCALVGANSSGKSNILKAINILLGETYPTERAFKRDDFYNRDTNNTIEIEISFDQKLESVYLTPTSGSKRNVEITRFKLTCTNNNGGNSIKFLVYDENDNEFYGNGEIRSKISFICIPADRNLEKQTAISQWTLLGKILKKIDEDFRTNIENEGKFKELMKEPLELLDGDATNKYSFTKFKSILKEKMDSNLNGHANHCNLKLDIYDPLWYYKTLQIQIEEGNQIFNINEIGSGTQNLVLISIFQAYSKYCNGNIIFGFEEPELYLFPNAQRSLYESFIEISQNSQIFYTTHSPLFLSINNANNIIMLKKGANGTYKTNQGSLSELVDENEKNKVHLLTKFSYERNELFFADKVILVEGETEEKSLPYVIEVLLENKKINYTIVNCQSKDLIPFFIKVCKFLGISDFLVIYDTDQDPKKSEDARNLAKKSTDKILENLTKEEISNKTIPLDYDFETVCGYSSTKKEKVLNALNWAKNIKIDQIPNDLTVLKNFLLFSSNDEKETYENLPSIPQTNIDFEMPF